MPAPNPGTPAAIEGTLNTESFAVMVVVNHQDQSQPFSPRVTAGGWSHRGAPTEPEWVGTAPDASQEYRPGGSH